MAEELKITEFDPLLSSSTDIANNIYDVSSEDIIVRLADEDDQTYTIQDVTYDPDMKAILIKFDHDE